MAEIIRCDGGCGAESPDPKTKLHEANHWLKVRAAPALYFRDEADPSDRIYCHACAEPIYAALKHRHYKAKTP